MDVRTHTHTHTHIHRYSVRDARVDAVSLRKGEKSTYHHALMSLWDSILLVGWWDQRVSTVCIRLYVYIYIYIYIFVCVCDVLL